MELLVVGAGAMGRWFAGTMVRKDSVSVAFADTEPGVARAAAEGVPDARAIDLTENTEDGERFEVVCLAVPMGEIETAIAEHARLAGKAIVDVTGVMATPTAAMAEYAPERERASFHPLFGPENAPGSIAVVSDAPGPRTDTVRSAFESAGNTVFETTPEEHDAAMETVQARAHTAILAFALAAEDVPEEFTTPISDALDDLVAGVTGDSPGVYRDIQTTFDGAEDVAEAAGALSAASPEEFEALYRVASERRRSTRGDANGNRGNDEW